MAQLCPTLVTRAPVMNVMRDCCSPETDPRSSTPLFVCDQGAHEDSQALVEVFASRSSLRRCTFMRSHELEWKQASCKRGAMRHSTGRLSFGPALLESTYLPSIQGFHHDLSREL